MKESRSSWACLLRTRLQVFRFPRMAMAQYSEFATSLKVFGFCMQQKTSSKKFGNVQPSIKLASFAESFQSATGVFLMAQFFAESLHRKAIK